MNILNILRHIEKSQQRQSVISACTSGAKCVRRTAAIHRDDLTCLHNYRNVKTLLHGLGCSVHNACAVLPHTSELSKLCEVAGRSCHFSLVDYLTSSDVTQNTCM